MKQRHFEYDFIAGSNPEELGGSYWMNGERLTRSFCQELPAGLGGPAGHSNGGLRR